ncbi:hypothetical protein SEA_SUCCESS_77 [Streptomyces phage Success]|uniref:Uncharacterized protein n=1 Tax=Streptomyces phage Success TaxID=2999013 RepID=A0A9E8M5K3_9CAUD|nr:hypothetical protein QEH47_gp55 [Streptomyces phage Success]WAB08856.1 hypothetical protein SEA_SUCCESS_77 [Streptomyces phage Success]
MSASNRWAVDMAEAVTRATAAAGNSNPHARIAAFRELCAELGPRANQYHCPRTALHALVNVAAYAYASERMRVRHG